MIGSALRRRPSSARWPSSTGPFAPTLLVRMPSPPPALRTLADRFDPQVFDVGRPRARLRLVIDGAQAWDAVLAGGTVRLEPADESDRPDAVLSGDQATWRDVAGDLRRGMAALRAG